MYDGTFPTKDGNLVQSLVADDGLLIYYDQKAGRKGLRWVYVPRDDQTAYRYQMQSPWPIVMR